MALTTVTTRVVAAGFASRTVFVEFVAALTSAIADAAYRLNHFLVV